MEFSVKKYDLLQELSLTQGVVERKTTIPILGHILCEAAGNRVTLTATDLELSIRTSCEAKVKKEGAGTIPAKKLLELVRLLPEGELRFKLLDNHWVQILADRKTYKMVGMSKDNFPTIPAFPHPFVKIPASILSSLIAKTSFAISNEESRYTLNGAAVDQAGFDCNCRYRWPPVVAGGARSQIRRVDARSTSLIPKKALAEVQRLASEAGDESEIEFAMDESHCSSRLGPAADFAHAHRAVPKLRGRVAAGEQQESGNRARRINDAVRRVSQLADQRSHAVKISVSPAAWRFPPRVPNMAKPRRPSRRNIRASRWRSVSMRST